MSKGLALKWALILAAAGLLAYQLASPKGGLPIGGLAPPLEGPLLSGQPFSLADHQGKVVVLDFFGVYCPPCRKSLPAFQQVYAAHRDDPGVAMVAVSTDGVGLADVTQGFVKQHGLAFPVLLDDQAASMSTRYQVETIPMLVVINPQGKIHSVDRGIKTGSVAGIAEHLEARIKEARE